MSFNYFETGVFIFLFGMIIYGHSRGFLKIAVTTLALLITAIGLNIANPYVRDMIQENTTLNHTILTTVYQKVGLDHMNEDSSTVKGRQEAIDGLNIPGKIKDILIKNDKQSMYEKLGVYTFVDYIASYVTQMIVNAISFVISFVLVWLVLGILFKGSRLLAKIPVVHGVNQLVGAGVGLFVGLMIVWVAFIFILAFSTTTFGSRLFVMVENSGFLLFLSKINPIAHFLGL